MKSLLSKVTQYFPEYKPDAVHNLLLLTLCLLEGKTTCLYKLRGHVAKFTGKGTRADSGYKRLIRIFNGYAHSRLWLDLLRYSFRMLRLKSSRLILDGTSWKHNGHTRHYLMLSIVYQHVAIPIYWVDLAKLGISSMKERKQMFRRAFKHFSLKGMMMLADREYIGKDWFNYLIGNGLGFTIRIRHKDYKAEVDAAGGLSYERMVAKVSNSKKPCKALSKRIEMQGQAYTFVVSKYRDRSGKVQLLLLLSTSTEKAAKIAGSYKDRWKIEHCFKHLKSNGFELEKINLEGPARCALLMAVMVFAYVLSIHEGLKTYRKVRVIQAKDGSESKAESVFRHGLDNLLGKLATMECFLRYIVAEVRRAMNGYRSAKWAFV